MTSLSWANTSSEPADECRLTDEQRGPLSLNSPDEYNQTRPSPFFPASFRPAVTVMNPMRTLLLAHTTIALSAVTALASAGEIRVSPATAVMRGQLDRLQLQVTDAESGRDLTAQATFTAEPADIVTVTESGQVRPLKDGKATIRIQQEGALAEVAVEVTGVTRANPVSFREQVIPVLSKAGCNQGACHASQYGKGNFKLSLFGFAPEQDHSPFVRDWQQRRVSFVRPEDSLILRKATLEVSHGGGRRFDRDSFEYRLLHAWLSEGATGPQSADPKVIDLTVLPAERVYQSGQTQQLRVIAEYSDQSERDVTHLARYDSMGEGTASVDAHGLVAPIDPGQAPIMIRYQGQAKVSMVLVPRESNPDLTAFQSSNLIDEKVREHWQ